MSNADWWASKLAKQNPQQAPQVGRPANMPPMPPSQVPMTPMPTFQQPSPTSKAQSANIYDSCPDCGSGNFFSATPQTAKRCYDCGYPVQQSGSRFGGLAGANVEGAAKQAAGNDATNNWNPQGIVGKVQ